MDSDIKQKNACVIGAGGFIGHNLVKRLKKDGWFVVGIDLKEPMFEKTSADRFLVGDFRNLDLERNFFDRIYSLAAQMGGAGYIFTGENDAEILSENFDINSQLLKQLKNYKGIVFYSSSVCCYPDGVEGREENAYPANPPSLYGWEKLTSEQLYLACKKKYGLNVKIARFHNTFGPNGTYKGGREKFPASICRKVAETSSGGEIEIWGTGEQLRPFIFIDDLLDGIEALLQSSETGPINLGPQETRLLKDVIELVIGISGKDLRIKYVDGPTGEIKRYTNCQLAKTKLNWEPKVSLEDAFKEMYSWVSLQLWQ